MAAKELIYLLACTVVTVGALLDTCPPLESTACRCEIRSGPNVFCSKIQNREILKSIFESLKGYRIEALYFSDVSTSSLPMNDLARLHVEQLVIENFEVKDAEVIEEEFVESPLENSLKIFQVSHSFKRDQPLLYVKLDNFNKLEAVLMNDNNIPEVKNDWFASGPKSLFIVTLDRNNIQKLGDKAFKSLENLQVLWVRSNPLSELSRSMFPSPANKLEKLDLSHNKISKLPKDLFSDMPSLEYINLAHNQVKVFAEDNNILKIARIHLEGNPLQCDEKLKWLCAHEVNFNTAKCDSPSEKRGILLTGFCDS